MNLQKRSLVHILVMSTIILALIPNFAYAQLWQGNGRIAVSSDGNQHDSDDWAATAVTLAIIGNRQLQDKLVHYDYADHVWNNNNTFENNVQESALGAAQRFGYDQSRFFNSFRNRNAAINSIKNAVNASSANDRLYFIVAGPMEVPYQGILAADANKRQYVTCISHSLWNDNHGDCDDGLAWTECHPGSHHKSDIVALGVNWVGISDQNANKFNTGSMSPWNFLNTLNGTYDAAYEWTYTRVDLALTTGDASDCGMAYFLFTGDQNGNPAKLNTFMRTPVSNPVAQAAFNGPHNLPGTVEAEDYDTGGQGVAYNDTDAGNNGNQYRTDNVDVQTASEGGFNIGWTAAGEWLEYTVNVSNAGTYNANIRYAALNKAGAIRIEFDGVNKTGTVGLPLTGGWQTYQTVTQAVSLSAGEQVMRVFIEDNGYNLNSISFTSGSTSVPVTGVSVTPASVSINTGQTSALTATVAPSNATNKSLSWTSNNTSVATVSGSGVVTAVATGTATITATTVDGGFSDNTSVTVASTGGGCNADYEEQGGLVVIEAENIDVSGTNWGIKTAKSGFTGSAYLSWDGGNSFGTPGNGLISATIKINSPGRYRFQWRNRVGLGTNATEHNDSWLRFPDADDFYGEKAGGGRVYPKGSGKTPVPNGAGADGWFKVYLSNTTDWTWGSNTSDNDSHPIYVEFDNAGTYTMQISGRSKDHLIDRIAIFKSDVNGTALANNETPCTGGGNVSVTGVSVSPASLALNTGQTSTLSAAVLPSNATNQSVSWSSNNTSVATVNASGVVTAVAAGNASITGTTADGGFTDNTAVTVTSVPSGQTPFGGTARAIPGTIESEDYDNGGAGVAYNDTGAGNNGNQYRTDDVDVEVSGEGGFNVGWTATGEWLEYTVNVASAGTYDVAIRYAALSKAGAIRLEFGGVDKTGTVSLPATGGWQTYQTANASVSLTAGQQVMRVFVEDNGYNLNNVAFTATTPAQDQVSLAGAPTTITSSTSISIPVTYTATIQREIVASFWKAGVWQGNGLATVAAGSGSTAITVTLGTAPVPASDYAYKVHIRPVGTTFAEAIDEDEVTNVTVEGQSQPQTVTLSPINDAYLQGSTNFNTDILRIESGNRVGYLMYDLSSVTGTVTAAELQFTVIGDAGSGNVNVNLGSSNNWNETNLSAANKPAAGSLLGSINETYAIGNLKTVALQASAITGSTVSLVVAATGGNDFAFASKENTGATAPQLVVTYLSGGARQGVEANESSLSVYPNPVSGNNVTLDLNGYNNGASVKVMDQTGKVVFTTDTDESSLNLGRSSFPTSGVYIINVTGDNSTEMIKLIVQ